MNIILNKSHLTDIEHDIRPPLSCAVTLPVIIDGQDSGICVYVAATAFRPDVDPADVSRVAELLQVVW